MGNAMKLHPQLLHINFLIILTAALLYLPLSASALTVENIPFPDSITIVGKPVPLRGAALLRWFKLLKVYVAALYLPDGIKPSEALSDIPKRLELSYLVSIPGPDFGKGAEPILERNLTVDELKRLRSRIDRINSVYRDVKPTDRYALTYQPGKGTELSFNGIPLVTIEGADFAAAYFGIWLGKEPIDEKMRDRLTGKN
jgi:hypothetical protein